MVTNCIRTVHVDTQDLGKCMGSGKWVGHDPSGAGWPGVWLVAGYPPRTASLGVLSVVLARKARTTLPRAAGGPRRVPWAPRSAHSSSTTPGRAAIHQGGAWEGATALFYHSRHPHRQNGVLRAAESADRASCTRARVRFVHLLYLLPHASCCRALMRSTACVSPRATYSTSSDCDDR